MHSIFRGEAMRSLMIEHDAKIPEINPSAARFALDEMLGFVLVGVSVLGNIFSAGDLHSSLFNLCFPHCVSLRDAFRFRALMMPIHAIMVGPLSSTTRSRASTAACHSSRSCSALGSFWIYSAASLRMTSWRPRGR